MIVFIILSAHFLPLASSISPPFHLSRLFVSLLYITVCLFYSFPVSLSILHSILAQPAMMYYEKYMTRNKRKSVPLRELWLNVFEVIFSYYVHFKQQMNLLKKNLCQNKIKFLWTEISFPNVTTWMCVDYYYIAEAISKQIAKTKRKIKLSEMCVIKINQKAKL